MIEYNYNRVLLKSKKKQSGVATVVFVMLVGLALTATGTKVMNSVQSNQHKQVAVNSVTHAQTGVWVGAEAFRLYLAGQEASAIANLSDDLDIALDASFGSVSARNIQVETMADGLFRVSADVINTHSAARSSAALSIVYEVDPGTASPVSPPSAAPLTAVDFNDDLTLNNGGLELIGAGGGTFDIKVNGDVELGGLNVNPLGLISATGKVTIGSNVVVEDIYANDDVELNTTSVNTVRTLGDFYAGGGASVGQLWANGDVTIQASGRFDSVHTLKNVSILTAGYLGHGYFNAGETISVDNAGPVDRLEAVGDVSLNTWSTISDVVSMGDISCVSQWWNNFTSLAANGGLNSCSSSGSTQGGASNIVTSMTPLEPYTHENTTVDVWAIQSAANYIVGFDSAQNRIKVTVNNVHGITSGSEFFVGQYNNYNGVSYLDYLCETVNGSGKCMAPAEPLIPLCIGESLNNGCIQYNEVSNTFTMNPNTTAPGVMWFDGNLKLGNGFGVTTYLAAGNIETFGDFKSSSANFGGYDKTCMADATHIDKPQPVKDRYSLEFSAHYPTNLCDIANGVYLPDGTGNIALAAGGYDPDDGGSYSGGNITLGASTEVTGAVLAGNVLETGGETTINGVVSTSGKGVSGENYLAGSTTIDLSVGSSTYNPFDMPDMSGDDTDGDTDANSTDVISPTRMLWVKYL